MFRSLRIGEDPTKPPSMVDGMPYSRPVGNLNHLQHKQRYTYKPYKVSLKNGQQAYVLGRMLFLVSELDRGFLRPRDVYTGNLLQLDRPLSTDIQKLLFNRRYLHRSALTPDNRDYMQRIFKESGLPQSSNCARYKAVFPAFSVQSESTDEESDDDTEHMEEEESMIGGNIVKPILIEEVPIQLKLVLRSLRAGLVTKDQINLATGYIDLLKRNDVLKQSEASLLYKELEKYTL